MSTTPLESQTDLVEAIAQRVAELLAEHAPPEFVDAATLARMFGISRSAVYERQRDLGAVWLPPLPGHTQPLVRFDVARARAAWRPLSACDVSERSGPEPITEPSGDEGLTRRPPRRRRSPNAAHSVADLLPIRGAA